MNAVSNPWCQPSVKSNELNEKFCRLTIFKKKYHSVCINTIYLTGSNRKQPNTTNDNF